MTEDPSVTLGSSSRDGGVEMGSFSNVRSPGPVDNRDNGPAPFMTTTAPEHPLCQGGSSTFEAVERSRLLVSRHASWGKSCCRARFGVGKRAYPTLDSHW